MFHPDQPPVAEVAVFGVRHTQRERVAGVQRCATIGGDQHGADVSDAIRAVASDRDRLVKQCFVSGG